MREAYFLRPGLSAFSVTEGSPSLFMLGLRYLGAARTVVLSGLAPTHVAGRMWFGYSAVPR
jgi:hypothetical protein